ncbi:TPA: hypothetical protein WM442_000462 [Neisseria gonorrhoeae]
MTLPMQETRFSILLDELAAKQEATIAPYLLADGTKVWVRKAGRHNARWRYALLGMVARYLKLGVLKPVPSLGGEPAIATESKRLYELRSAGIAVPELLAVRKNALMFGNLEGIPKPILPIRRLEHPRWGRDALRLAASISLISLADMPP